MWDDQWATFAQQYRVVRFDLRGFGRSTSEATPFSDVDDIVALLDHLRIERAHFVGLSMGARVAVDFALVHPERVGALVSADGVLSGFGPLPQEVLDVFALAADGHVSEATERWLSTSLFVPAMEIPQVADRLRRMVSDFGWWRMLHPGLVQPIDLPVAGRLREIATPTLVIAGERDIPMVITQCQALTEGIRDARYVALSGTGHMSNMEDPSTFNAAVRDFLAGLANSTQAHSPSG